MIGRILYRETVHGVLNYVFGKNGSTILGFQNTISEFGTTPKFFANTLHFQGQRHDSASRYAHITLNLPHGEHLDDKTFYKVAKDYMDEMGYGEQPYVVVRHSDTIHEHVHLVSTTVNESGTLINLRNDYHRNVATQRFLEKKYGLSPSPGTKVQRDLPKYRLPELQLSVDENNGTKFYMQDVINGLLQKYKVRGFEELARLAKPYHIVVRTMTHASGRVGVAYGIDNQKQYNTQFINGYVVHPELSGPKLRTIFEKYSKSKLLPMHKKRLEKQLLTTFKLFNNIKTEDLPDVLKSYQNIDCQLLYGRNRQLADFIIYDKSGYTFKASEISLQHDWPNNSRLSGDQSSETHIDIGSNQFSLEIKKLIKNAFYKSYLGTNKSKELLSEFVVNRNLKDLLPLIARTEHYSFLNHYLGANNGKMLPKTLKNRFDDIRAEFAKTESKREIKKLEIRTGLIKKVLEKSVFDITNDTNIAFYLLRGLGLKYHHGNVTFLNSGTHSIPLTLQGIIPSNSDEAYISTGSINQNEKVLEMLTADDSTKAMDLNPTSFFLPILMPELYGSMTKTFRTGYEKKSLKAFHKAMEGFNILFEKSPTDYIRLFNARGFFFEARGDKIHVASIYSKYPVSVPLRKNTNEYLSSLKNLDDVLKEQRTAMDSIKKQGRGQLKNLWVSYLMEKQWYGKVAYIMVYEGIQPNLHPETMEYHMENGLREKLIEMSNRKVSAEQASLLRKSVYAFSSLLGGDYKEEDVFNGFKDEFTDYSKYKSLFI
ncbi:MULTISPECIES: relaxase/mobilization nuclease domain-containing protein [Flavobacteriaceae]|jgi:hypothetical protein|uniref:MobA/VirD2-like nuclease domain-containing protein n=4 Tax=Flagellimonas TaxID=444459 RepID=A0A371JVJ0_9FLAO|nr:MULTISPECIES: relaxase/mobilization nuclease domain-containing protein [Allomuricauda]MBO0340729.1 relaxase/mobilization nuclease domain-containing protein [Allomuricauda profundi]MBO6533463.1 relaxase/mobilization nuclease domain-containing protein [Allomuricauda sp.]MBO6589682.1 relaxase/mobilization nuclease domain-containing protein [Allomuricauda sp.]MBO6619385.1 relaxase/mobilization nuclease domain-containing protein [Allomuricauda sp.]MBO6645296.1 relaxase/mobilization nuclease doma|tara:strand:- start:23880 stop:26177 length:2298 start_codon:yes stop_codon:yes gene_type:complete